jgi:hypothetical protein
MEEQSKFEGWAVVELMGHNTVAGFVSEQTIAGAAMLRVDVPAVDERGAFTKFYGGSAIYGITPTTQEIAERAAQRLRVRPVSEYVVPAPPVRPALVDGEGGLVFRSGLIYVGPPSEETALSDELAQGEDEFDEDSEGGDEAEGSDENPGELQNGW